MFRLGTLWGYGATYIPLDEEVERISQVTLADLREVAQAFPLNPTVRVVVLPNEAANETTNETANETANENSSDASDSETDDVE
jgi:predicted Zn-dependent peptidase